MVPSNLESQLLALNTDEKTQVIELLLQSIREKWVGIEKTPTVCGGAACIRRTRIPVWVLVQARNLGSSEIDLLRDYPTLNAKDLANAWAYASSHAKEIEETIRENDEA
ncbi:MAG: DUF433 domain-containing protein [Cyanobacteria bacterium J06597_16]